MIHKIKKKLKVAVLMGGNSSEHEISLLSGKEVIKNLDRNKYQVFPILISKSGDGIEKLLSLKIDVVFIALHGRYGEDGSVQGFLETLGLLYTGSGVLASAIGIDKITFRKIMKFDRLPIPKFTFLKKDEDLKKIKKVLGKPPYFVKPFNQGSSVGASPVLSVENLKNALRLAFEYSDTVLIDEYLTGPEFTCAVMGNEDPTVLPVIEIRPLKGEYFDYESKYSENGAEENVPAKISKKLTKKIQDLAIKVYKAIGCSGFARVDLMLNSKGEPIILEINTVPGLTPTSLFPKAAKAKNISYPQLLDTIIRYAIQKN